jgi:DNA repair protein RadC
MIVNTEVIDHLIISDKSYLSFGDIGLLEELKKSTKYVPTYVLEKRFKKEATEIAEQNKAIEIAKAMKKSGEPIEKIALFTGLPEEEIQQLRVKKN